jgi:hypothetical protein
MMGYGIESLLLATADKGMLVHLSADDLVSKFAADLISDEFLMVLRALLNKTRHTHVSEISL